MDHLNVRIHAGLDLWMLRRLRETVESEGLISFSNLQGALQCDESTLRRHVDYWMNAGYLECLFPSHVIGRENYDSQQFPVFYRWTHSAADSRPGMNSVKQVVPERKPPVGYRVLQWWKRNRPFSKPGLKGLAPC